METKSQQFHNSDIQVQLGSREFLFFPVNLRIHRLELIVIQPSSLMHTSDAKILDVHINHGIS